MKINKLVTSFFVVFALLTGAAGCSSTEKSKTQHANESAITSKIQSKFAADPDLSGLDLKVETDKNGVVVLRGTANTQAEADKAHATAHSVEGVKKVINHIKVKKDY